MTELTYGQKLIAEAIEMHFGERRKNYDEDEDGDTCRQDAWEAFDEAFDNAFCPPALAAHDTPQAVESPTKNNAVTGWMSGEDFIGGYYGDE